MVKLFDEADYPEGVGHIRNVTVRRMHVFRASDHSHQPLIDFRTRVQCFSIEDFRRDHMRDVSPDTPTLRVTQTNSVDLVLEGITVEQLSDVQGYSSPVAHHSNGMALVYKQETCRGTFVIKSADLLILPTGGFSILQANAFSSNSG